jgi:hypothetical protein
MYLSCALVIAAGVAVGLVPEWSEMRVGAPFRCFPVRSDEKMVAIERPQHHLSAYDTASSQLAGQLACAPAVSASKYPVSRRI